jgi:hypothetical protein
MRPLAEVGRALFMIVVLSAEAAIGVFGPATRAITPDGSILYEQGTDISGHDQSYLILRSPKTRARVRAADGGISGGYWCYRAGKMSIRYRSSFDSWQMCR